MSDNTTNTTNNLNRPRNILFANADPRQPVGLEFSHAVGASLQTYNLNIQQSNHDDVWPGGALWDCGILLSLLVLGVAGVHDNITLTATPLLVEEEATTSSKKSHKKTNNKSTAAAVLQKTFSQVSNRLVGYCTDSRNYHGATLQTVQDVLLHRPHLRIVEFGCGVGLTGLVAAVALGASSTILTDLTVVVEQVTHGNVELNTTAHTNTIKKKPINNANTPGPLLVESSRTIRHFKGLGKVLAMPLCWGNLEEGEQVLKALQALHQSALQHQHSASPSKKKKKHNASKNAQQLQPNNDNNVDEEHSAYPDLILLGDVAYQHKRGAPSHFDVLLQSLLQLMPPIETTMPSTNTKHWQQILLFGTRIRMPASMDLFELMQSQFSLLMSIPAHCLDPTLEHFKHNMTVHVFTNKIIAP